MKSFGRSVPALALCTLLSSCTPANEQDEAPTEEKDSFVPYTWVTDTTMHKIILRMVEEEDGEIESPDPIEDPRTGELNEEVGAVILVKVGMLAGTDDGYTVASHAELDQLPGDPDVSPAELASAMGSILRRNDVRWCGEPVSAMDFRNSYLDRYNQFDKQPYDTQEEFLESIEDYVDCGTG